jgi:hypothetical protein
MEKIVLAFDIERSGCGKEHDTIAMGASVVDSNMNELDNFFFKCYIPGETNFEQRCMDEFWSKNLEVLKTLEYHGDKTKKVLELEMITGFQNFRKKWELFAEENGKTLVLASDNKVYDGGFVNQLIFEHLPGTLPIPYSAGKQKYSAFYETHSEQRGLLFSVDSGYDKNWGFTDRIIELYSGMPEPKKMHDHNPANDAYSIAFDQQVLFGIREGKFTLKNLH